MAEEARSRLGRGLAALMGDVGDETEAIERTRSQKRVPVEFLHPNPRNPRRLFAEVELLISPSLTENAIPVGFRHKDGEATAAATVRELNRIVRPEVWSVRRSASFPKPRRAASSR